MIGDSSLANLGARAVAEAFEKISDEELVKEHINYFNVFFGDKKSLRRKMIEEYYE